MLMAVAGQNERTDEKVRYRRDGRANATGRESANGDSGQEEFWAWHRRRQDELARDLLGGTSRARGAGEPIERRHERTDIVGPG